MMDLDPRVFENVVRSLSMRRLTPQLVQSYCLFSLQALSLCALVDSFPFSCGFGIVSGYWVRRMEREDGLLDYVLKTVVSWIFGVLGLGGFTSVTVCSEKAIGSSPSVSDNDVCNIVLSYLMHNCFKETAETFLSSTGLKLPVEYSVDVDKRKAIFTFVLEGNALKAIELTEELAPNLLENDMDLHFDLLSLHFIELVRSRKCTEALEFGQKKLTSFGKVPKYVEKLEDFMALLAYEEPEKSPMFHLLSPEYRQNVADGLNRAVLAHANLPAYSSLERVIQQAAVVRQYLQQEVGKDSYPPFSLKAFLSK